MMIASSDRSTCNEKRKRAVELSPQPLVGRAKKASETQQLPVMVVSPVQPSLSVQSVPYTPVLPASFPGDPNQFDVAMKRKLRNWKQRVRRRKLREKKKKENEVMRETSQVLDGSRLHDFIATEKKDDFEKMLTSPPRSPKELNKLTPEERTRQCVHQLRDVFQKAVEKSVMNEEVKSPPLIEEDKSPIDNTVEVQSYSRNKQRFVRQSAVSDGYGIESQARVASSEEIILLDDTISSLDVPSRPKMFDLAERMRYWFSASKTTKVEGPLRFRGLTEEDGSTIPFDEPRVPDYTLNSLLDDKSLGHRSQVFSSYEVNKVWRPKLAAPSILPSTTGGHSSSKIKEKEPMEVSNYQESIPSPVNHCQPKSEKSISKLMNDFRASLCKMDEKDFDEDNHAFMDEESYGFNTRKSLSLPGDPPTDGNTALIRYLLQQLKSKDEYILKLEKRMEEMTATMTDLIMQLAGSQQTLAVEKLLANADKCLKRSNVDDEIGLQSIKDFGYDLHPLSKDDLKKFISQRIKIFFCLNLRKCVSSKEETILKRV